MQGAPLRACLVVEARASGAVSVRLSETGTLRHQRARITRIVASFRVVYGVGDDGLVIDAGAVTA